MHNADTEKLNEDNIDTVKALYFTWDLFCEIKYHAYIFSAQTFRQYIMSDKCDQ